MATTCEGHPETGGHAQASPFITRAKPPDPFALVMFGATGDLAGRKLFPALLQLFQGRHLPQEFAIVGIGRRDMRDEDFRGAVRKKLSDFAKDAKPADVDRFLSYVFYHRADVTAKDGLGRLAEHVQSLERERKLPGNRLFYLATDPEFFLPIVEQIAGVGLICRDEGRCWARVVIEKPFGFDLASALELDRNLRRYIRPDQIYRIDHYLGKETVQNLLAFRFGNAVFEPLFTREHVEQVQITVAETVGMEGRRGAFYDHTGALRDVVQNHMLQLLALAAMDAPATLRSGDISDAKLKVLNSLVRPCTADIPGCVVRGQYRSGQIDGKAVRSYREEGGIEPTSNTETFVALRTSVESWRWAGVPFFLRTGKRLPRRATEIAIQFKLPPMQLFRTIECE